MHFLPFKEKRIEEVIMAQHLELVLKRDFASRLRQVAEKMRTAFVKTSEEDSKKKLEEKDWRDKAAKNWYY